MPDNITIVGFLGEASAVTVWRRLRRVRITHSARRHTMHTAVGWGIINALERDLSAAGWHMKISNGCRTEWVR